MPKPLQLAPFDTKEQRLYSEFPLDVRTLNSISKADPGQPAEETAFCHMYLRPSSFCHYPKLMAIGEG